MVSRRGLGKWVSGGQGLLAPGETVTQQRGRISQPPRVAVGAGEVGGAGEGVRVSRPRTRS
jgi:hypothetical protein